MVSVTGSERSDEPFSMAIEVEAGTGTAPPEADTPRKRARGWPILKARLASGFGIHVFSSLTRRIVILNLAALAALVSGILYLNQFRAGLIDARVESLLTQGEIIAGAISAAAASDSDSVTVDPERLLELQVGESLAPADEGLKALDFPINPEKIAPVMRRLISPTKTRARIYDRDGLMIVDSRDLYSRGQILRFDLPPPAGVDPGWFDGIWQWMKVWLRSNELPTYRELTGADGRGYPEVETALSGSPASIVRINERGEMIVSVAVPHSAFHRSARGVAAVDRGR